jgi:hypothetical protein
VMEGGFPGPKRYVVLQSGERLSALGKAGGIDDEGVASAGEEEEESGSESRQYVAPSTSIQFPEFRTGRTETYNGISPTLGNPTFATPPFPSLVLGLRVLGCVTWWVTSYMGIGSGLEGNGRPMSGRPGVSMRRICVGVKDLLGGVGVPGRSVVAEQSEDSDFVDRDRGRGVEFAESGFRVMSSIGVFAR